VIANLFLLTYISISGTRRIVELYRIKFLCKHRNIGVYVVGLGSIYKQEHSTASDFFYSVRMIFKICTLSTHGGVKVNPLVLGPYMIQCTYQP
jgi:hypothetical protein